MSSFKLLVVQHKPEVTKLWAFKFGLCTGRQRITSQLV